MSHSISVYVWIILALSDEILLYISILWQQPGFLNNNYLKIENYEIGVLAKNLGTGSRVVLDTLSISRNTIYWDKMFIIKYDDIKPNYMQHILTSFCRKTLHGSLGRDLFVQWEVCNISAFVDSLMFGSHPSGWTRCRDHLILLVFSGMFGAWWKQTLLQGSSLLIFSGSDFAAYYC